VKGESYKQLRNLYFNYCCHTVITSGIVGDVACITHVEREKWVENYSRKRKRDNKINPAVMWGGGVDLIHLSENKDKWWVFVNTVIKF
jgi:hypothetical protein